MSLYTDRVLPHLLNLAMRHKDLAAYRRRLVPADQGQVLEIGIGSGLNLPFFGKNTTEVVGLDPSGSLLRMARRGIGPSGPPVEMIEGSAKAIPRDDASFDPVLTT